MEDILDFTSLWTVFVIGVSRTSTFNWIKRLLSGLARDVVRQHHTPLVFFDQNEMANSLKATATTCFDTELFGHWWHEGPQFLEEVIRTLSQDKHVRITSPASIEGQSSKKGK